MVTESLATQLSHNVILSEVLTRLSKSSIATITRIATTLIVAMLRVHKMLYSYNLNERLHKVHR